MNVVIIEDEPKAAMELKDILRQIDSEINVLAILESVQESLEWFNDHTRPDLVFSDIQLSDGVSFDIFRKVKMPSPVIFVTAYDEYMMDAFENNGIHYLLKPITKNKVEDSVVKYNELKASFIKEGITYSSDLDKLLNQICPNYQSSLLVHFKEKIVPVRVDEIAYFHYSNGTVLLTLFNGQKYFIDETLDDLEATLNPHTFFRANRQNIVHRNSVKEVERYFSRKLLLRLHQEIPEPIVVSKLKASDLLKWLEQHA